MSFNFLYYPLVYRAGREGGAIPGAQVLQAPRGAHRHRQQDLLAMFLTVSGDHRYDPEEIQTITQAAAASFFQLQGSVTRAMQAVCETLNKSIYDRNLDRGFEGIHAIGTLNLAVLHNDWLFIAQVGKAQTVLISADQIEMTGESNDTGEYLGQSRRIQVRFSQSELTAGDLVILCDQPPASWSVGNLAGSAVLGMAQVKRRLLSQVSDSLEAMVIKCAVGDNKVEFRNWSEPPTEPERKPDLPAAEELDETQPQELAMDAKEEVDRKTPSEKPEIPEPQAEESAGEPIEEGSDEPEEAIYLGEGRVPVIEGETEKPLPDGESPESEPETPQKASAFMLWLARTWMNAKAFNEKVRHFNANLFSRFNPKGQTTFTNSSSFFMILMALVVPLALILVSVTVYTQSGKTEQHQSLLAQAQQAAVLAAAEKDAAQQHTYWAQALDLVTQAQEFDVTQESRALFEKAQTTLDEMDLAGRLDFRPALTQFFPEGVVIGSIHSSSSGVYLLDQTSGSILRIYLNTKGFYELDSEFQCMPGPYGLSTVTKLIDFVVLPANSENYRIMAIDGQGNLLYCRPGELPDSRTLTSPSGGWNRIIGAAYDDDILYVLDTDNDAVWMYEGKDPEKTSIPGIVFAESPVKFFDEDIPDLGGAIDLNVNQEDLYILHEDGHMSLCRYSALKDVKLTECQDPAPYSDSRVGREKNPWVFMDSRFEMMQQTLLPNAALYILDGANRSINQFSFQLNLERVLKVQENKSYPVPDANPSGFGITSDMEIFLAFNNQLFIAPLQ